MKKSVIKRRKRVVPALQQPSPTGQAGPVQPPSPEIPPTVLAQLAGDHPEKTGNPTSSTRVPGLIQTQADELSRSQPGLHYPLPVDFTDYRVSPNESLHIQPAAEAQSLLSGSLRNDPNSAPSPHPNPTAWFPTNAKKRSVSAAAGEGEGNPDSRDTTRFSRLSSISSILNHNQSLTDDHLDPSLVTLTKQQQRPQQSNCVSQKADKRAQLEEETQRMREALRAKEKELAELS